MLSVELGCIVILVDKPVTTRHTVWSWVEVVSPGVEVDALIVLKPSPFVPKSIWHRICPGRHEARTTTSVRFVIEFHEPKLKNRNSQAVRAMCHEDANWEASQLFKRSLHVNTSPLVKAQFPVPTFALSEYVTNRSPFEASPGSASKKFERQNRTRLTFKSGSSTDWPSRRISFRIMPLSMSLRPLTTTLLLKF